MHPAGLIPAHPPRCACSERKRTAQLRAQLEESTKKHKQALFDQRKLNEKLGDQERREKMFGGRK